MPNVTVYVVTNWQNLPAQVTPIDATNLNHLETGVKNVTDFINSLHAESGLYLCATPFLAADRTKLDGIDEQANKYVLPTATTGSLGGVKVDGVTITINENGVISSAASSTSLENLTDVDLDELADGQILKYDSENSKWVNATNEAVTTLANLTDTEITNPSDGQILKYDAASGKWINATGGGSVGDLDDLGDVELTDPSEGQYLRYDEVEEKWINDDGVEELSYNDTLTALGEPAVEPSQDIESYQYDLVYDSGAEGTWAPNDNTTVNFIKAIDEYDELEILVQDAGDILDSTKYMTWSTRFKISNFLNSTTKIPCDAYYGTRHLEIRTLTSTTFSYTSGLTNEQNVFIPKIRKIYGIKYNCMSVNQGSGFRIKSFTYTGDDNINNEITFPETPQIILGITSDNANGYKVSSSPVIWGIGTTWLSWYGTQKAGIAISLAYNGNVVTVVGADSGQSCNVSGATYTVYYI